MNILILGLPGSGKGTQAEILAKKLGLFYFQAGKLARELAKKDPKIDKIVNKKGGLIPEEEMTKYVLDYLEEKVPEGKNILFEGYPRFKSQYKNLKKWVKEKDSKVNMAILLKISEEEAVKRLSARRICKSCGEVYNLATGDFPPAGGCKCGGELVQREDDKSKAIQERFRIYEKNIKPLVEFIEKEGNLTIIDGERPIDVIAKDILSKVKRKDA